VSSRNRKHAKGKKIKVLNRPFFIRVKDGLLYITDWKDRVRTEAIQPFMDHKGQFKWQKIYDHIASRY
jgi:hypothetical protein